MGFASITNMSIKLFHYKIVANSFAALLALQFVNSAESCEKENKNILMRSNEANEFYIASSNFIFINHSYAKVYARCCK